MTTDLAEIIGSKESVNVEFKESAKSPSKIGRTICAFANDIAGYGVGHLLVGVADDGTPVDKVDTSDQGLLKLAEFRDSGQILDRPSMTVEVGTFRGKPVVHIKVVPCRTPPVRFEGVVWVRPGPTTRRATRDEERILSERRRAADGPYDTRAVPGATLDDLDLSLFRSDYLPSVVAQEVIEENERPVEHQLASLRMAEPDGTPTVVGLLTLGTNPSGFIPGAYIQFVRYQGSDLDAPIADDQELRGNLIGTATQLGALLRGHVHTRVAEVDVLREKPRPDYPLEALRELCMNAIMHRNYETSFAPTRVFWFGDRIEVLNPGGPFGQVRPDNFDRVNDYRNPSLAAAMKSLGFVNRFGRGVGRVRKALAVNGNPPAEYVIDDSSWSVTVRRAP
jgi:ATP-dependent DNA helicase RecG